MGVKDAHTQSRETRSARGVNEVRRNSWLVILPHLALLASDTVSAEAITAVLHAGGEDDKVWLTPIPPPTPPVRDYAWLGLV